ncbi:MAG: DUF1453 domain-containing protein [Rhodanobacteraceae bacterium]
MSHDPYVFAAMAALILFALYRRFRGVFGRQPLRPAKLKSRIAVLAVVALLFGFRALHSPAMVGAGVAGLALGAAFAWWGLKLTRFDMMPGGVFYTPNAYLGAALAAVLVGRVVYRFVALYPALQTAKAETGSAFAGYTSSPLTFALFALVIGYYIVYCAGLITRANALRVDAGQTPDVTSPPSAP